ncbi:protein MpaA [Oxalobacteraceae bacterium GrIS 2.11]
MVSKFFACILSIAFVVSAHAESVKPAGLPNLKKPVNQWCAPLVGRLPKISLAQCQSSALQASGAVSKKGFPLLIKDIPAKINAEDSTHKQPVKILLIGGIHGDEKTASAIVFQWINKLSAPSALSANEFHWKIAPVVNPDGLLASKSTRVNANGVDLNRNFPTPNWLAEAPQYWRKKTQSDPRRFPGKAPLSEPESRWVFNQVEQFQPDVIISVHAPFGVLDFDGSGTPPSKFGRLMFNRVGVYPGSLGNYGGVHKDIPVVTIELPNSQQMPSDAEVTRIWQDMLSWVQLNITPQLKVAAK